MHHTHYNVLKLLQTLFAVNAGSQISIMTKLSEDDCSTKDEKKENETDVTNDPNHPLLKVRDSEFVFFSTIEAI